MAASAATATAAGKGLSRVLASAAPLSFHTIIVRLGDAGSPVMCSRRALLFFMEAQERKLRDSKVVDGRTPGKPPLRRGNPRNQAQGRLAWGLRGLAEHRSPQ